MEMIKGVNGVWFTVMNWSEYQNGKCVSEGVRIEIHNPKANFENIPLLEQHYDTEKKYIINNEWYMNLLFNKKARTTAYKALEQIGAKFVKGAF